MAVIDAATDTLVGSGILLNTMNPMNPYPGFALDEGHLYVATSGEFGAANGGIEIIDTAALKDIGVVVDGKTLGGDIDFFNVSGGIIYAVVTDATYNTSLVSYDTKAAKKATILTTNGFDLAGFAVNDRGELYVADRNATKPGIRIFDTKTGAELTAAPIDTGLPPFMPLFIK